jgi:uncharacterized membrane protein YqgA involved in biofilm formation
MLGTILNVAGILVGGIVGRVRRNPLSSTSEARFRVGLAAFTVFYGLRLTWLSLNGSLGQVSKQMLIVVLALMLGRLTGKLAGLQRLSNGIGHRASQRISHLAPNDPHRFSEGFKTCAALFCAAPLGLVGALVDGLSGSRYFYPLAVKAVMEGLANVGFVSLFGSGVLLAAVPVLALQGTLTLLSAYLLEPFLTSHGLLDSVNAIAGLLIFCVALVMLGLKRIALADYLPSLLAGPVLTWWWK